MNTANSIVIKIRLNDCLNNIASIGKLNAANIEASDMVLLAIKVTNQTNTVNPNTIFNPAILRDKPINTPKVVATPLPPLNWRKIVQL